MDGAADAARLGDLPPSGAWADEEEEVPMRMTTTFGEVLPGDAFEYRGTPMVVARTRWSMEYDHLIEVYWDRPNGYMGGIVVVPISDAVEVDRPT